MRSWRYAYDDADHLVATSDARGCGENLHYDRMGRIVAEDFSPCLDSQEPYTPYDANSGTGAEILSRYDFAEPGQVDGFGISAANLFGRLVSRLDRAGHVRYGYDMRGRLGWAARRLAKPGSGPVVPTGDWFRTHTAFDEAGRPTRTSTGADIAELLDETGSSDIDVQYGDNGALVSVGGSYGNLVTASAQTFSASPPVRATQMRQRHSWPWAMTKHGDLRHTKSRERQIPRGLFLQDTRRQLRVTPQPDSKYWRIFH